MSFPAERPDVLTVEVDEMIVVTSEFESAEGLPDRPAELRNVVRLVGLDSIQLSGSENFIEVQQEAVRLPEVKRRGA